MTNYLIVSAGAVIGGAARYWLSDFVYKFLPENFPLWNTDCQYHW